MTIRHKAVKATLDRGYASEWNDDHHLDPTDELMHVDVFFENAITNKWDTTQTTSGTAATIDIADNHVFLRLQATGGAGAVCTIRHKVLNVSNDIFHPDDLPVLTVSVQLVPVLPAGPSQEWGFQNNGAAPFQLNMEGAYFRVDNNVLYAITSDGVAETITNLGAPDEYGVYRVEFTSTSVKFYVDSLVTPAATHTTNLPANRTNVKLTSRQFGVTTTELRSDFVGLQWLRKR